MLHLLFLLFSNQLINDEVTPYEFNPDEAKKLLFLEGWKDEDRNGILEKGKEEFKFKMYYPVGNPLREYAAIVVKNNLKGCWSRSHIGEDGTRYIS